MLELRDIVCRYGKVTVLKGVSLKVERGQLVALIGTNGAGKTTTLKAISGLLKPASGSIFFDGEDISNAPARKILQLGIAHCPEGRRVFPFMSVDENLEMGCYLRSDRQGIAQDLERIFTQFPRLAERRFQAAGTLSGGEQQMLAIARILRTGAPGRRTAAGAAGPAGGRPVALLAGAWGGRAQGAGRAGRRGGCRG